MTSIVDRVYTFSVDGDKYEIKTISDSNKAGFKGQNTVNSYADKTLTLKDNSTAKIADDAVIFRGRCRRHQGCLWRHCKRLGQGFDFLYRGQQHCAVL